MGGGWQQKKKIADRVEGWNHEPWKLPAAKAASQDFKQAEAAARAAEAAVSAQQAAAATSAEDAASAPPAEAAAAPPKAAAAADGVKTNDDLPLAETPEDAMKRAATEAFHKALAEGATKEEARNIARDAGKAVYKAALKRAKAGAVKVVEVGAPPAPTPAPLPATTSLPPAPPPPPAVSAAASLPTACSTFGRAAETLEEQAARLRAMAIEKAERLERAEKERVRLKATKRRVVRSGA